MAKDLGLHTHHAMHNSGKSCASSAIECLTKTRVWQTLLICETMVGGPLGEHQVVAMVLDSNAR